MPPPLSFEQLRKRAKDLLRAARASGQPPFQLAEAQGIVAREAGFASWAELKRALSNASTARLAAYETLAQAIADLFAHPEREAAALDQLQRFSGRRPDAQQLRAQILQRTGAKEPFTLDDARRFVAGLYAVDTWGALTAAGAQRPFFRLRVKEKAIEPLPPVVIAEDWDELLDVMRSNGLTELRSAGQITDAVLRRIARDGEFVTSLQLEGSAQVTDAGLRYLAEMPQLEKLNLTGCSVTDAGMEVLRQLPSLREFYLYHHRGGVTDRGLSHLSHCGELERVDLLGSAFGDGALRALAGKRHLRHFKSGNQLTDDGLKLLHELPHFKHWPEGEPLPQYGLMSFDTAGHYLLLRGAITGRGLAHLEGLDGLFALNLDDARLQFSVDELQSLRTLPHLGWLGLDATDETMAVVGELPYLRMLMCQDTAAGDAGFVALSRSRTLEYIWGRRCYNLGGPGFTALSRMPSLKGLSVSCKNVPDDALATLPHFPTLIEYMPMDVQDVGFRHVGRMHRLEALWCMYCRETTDAATAQIVGLSRLRSYYAGATQITDASLEMLSGMGSLEKVELHACARVSNAGVGRLAALQRLRELTIGSMPAITRTALAAFGSGVHVTLEG